MEEFYRSKTDLHALRVLVQIHKEGSLSRAAERLGLTQSTLSYTLEKLRTVFNDPLFVRQGRGLVPTHRCDQLIPELTDMLHRFERLTEPEEFDPAASTETVVISCNYYERIVILPGLIRRIRAQAPHMRVRIETADTTGHTQLLNHEADLLMSPLVIEDSGLMTRHLLDERYACLFSGATPPPATWDMVAYQAAHHIVVDYDTGWSPFYIAHLKELGIVIDPAIKVPSFGGIEVLMREGDFVLTLPSRLARTFGAGFVALKPPFDVQFNIRLYWASHNHLRPLNVWLRQLAIEAAQEAAGI
jgi:DNA-binding transcriptional LysR family regulator